MSVSASDKLTVYLDELSACREEDRDSLNQMIAAIAACMTALSVIFAVVSGFFSGSNIDVTTAILCELITVAVLIAGFSYMISLGMISTLRFQRMRMLEREISKLVAKDGRVGWVDLKSSVSSLNPKHQYMPATVLHYAGTILSILGFFVAGICFVLMFWNRCPRLTFVLLVFLVLPYALFVVASFIWSTNNSEEWYKSAEIVGRKKIKGIKPSKERANAIGLFVYLLYPRPQDAAKVVFIILGCVLGIVAEGRWELTADNFSDVLLRMVGAWFIVDFLCYQARYQWNDILGAVDDEKNPMAKERGRLKAVCGELDLAKKVSAVFLLYKVAFAFTLGALFMDDAQPWFSLALTLILMLAVLYERTRRLHPEALKWIYVLVSLGYPLRLFAGYVCFADMVPTSFNLTSVIYCLVLLATAVYGFVFVSITWTLEGACFAQKQHLESPGKDAVGLLEKYHKRHIVALAKVLCDRTGGSGDLLRVHPLSVRRPMSDPWNIAMAATLALLVLANLACSQGLIQRTPFLLMPIFGILAPFAWCHLHPRSQKTLIVASALLIVLDGLLLLQCFGGNLSEAVAEGTLHFAVVAIASGYFFVYIRFRVMSYEEMVALPKKISSAAKNVIAIFWSSLLGSGAKASR